MESFISFLNFFGITPDKYPYVVFGFVLVFFIRFSIAKEIEPIRKEISSVRQEMTLVRQEIGSVRQEISSVHQEIGSVRKEIAGINGRLEFISAKLERVKDNVLVIISHLSAGFESGRKLDVHLVQAMSPLSITKQGYGVLEESGFEAIITIPEQRAEFMAYLSHQDPKTKYDVENLAIVSFALFLGKDFMTSIKTYLFKNTNVRESYQTLAGLYIRDEYLKDHPEIAQ